MKCLQ